MRRRILAILVTALMVFQTIPATVFADAGTDVKSQIGSHYEADQAGSGSLSEKDSWPNGTAVTDQDDWRVRVDKTIAAGDKENEFDITLTVDTKDKITTEMASPDAAVVFAVDLSASMEHCIEHGKVDNCGKERIDAALEALQTFINMYADSSASGKRMIAITGFYKDAYVITDWVQASTLTAPEGSINSKIAELARGLSSHSGTNIEGGLLLARNLLTSDTIKDIDFRTAILLSDGAANSCVVGKTEANKYRENYGSIPAYTYDQNNTDITSYTGYYNNADYHFHHGGAVDAIAQIKAGFGTGDEPKIASFESVYCGSADDVLTVHDSATNDNNGGCKQTGTNCKYCDAANKYWDTNGQTKDIKVTEFLDDNSDAFVESYDIASLVDAFEDIENRIEIATQAWRVTDPMGQYGVLATEFDANSNMAYNGDTRTLTWNLLDTEPVTVTEDGETIHRYTVTYRYKLDTFPADVKEGNYFATNAPTELKYYFQPSEGEASALESIWFNVPSIQGFKGELDFVKNGRTADGGLAPLAGAAFTVTHDEAECGCGFTHDPDWKMTAVSGNDGAISFTGIPSGHRYVLSETQVPGGYIGAEDRSFTVVYGEVVMDEPIGTDGIINEKEFIDIPVTKVWEDDDNRDGIRPASVTVDLLADSKTVDSVTLDETNEWSAVFEDMPALSADGAAIAYSVAEADVPDGYTSAVTGDQIAGYTVTNTHTPDTVDISGTKVWNDADDQDGLRPGMITVNLLADGEKVAQMEVTATDNWSWSFGSMPENKTVDGETSKIVYTVEEVAVDGYVTSYSKDDYTITNTHKPATVDVAGKKIWDDDNNRDGKRPESIRVQLYSQIGSAEPVAVKDGIRTVTGTGSEWTYEFTGLPKYAKVNGQRVEVVYSVKEIGVPQGYTISYDGNNITNKYTPETIDISGIKTWNDNDDQDGVRPASVTVNLLADGEVVKTMDVTGEGNDWSYEFKALPKYKEGAVGQLISYTVTENGVTDYTADIKGDAANGFVITNSHTPGKTLVTVVKVWDDNDNQDGIRPASIQVQLLADGQAKGDPVTLSKANNWTHNWTDLPEKAAGKDIAYTVAELSVTGYETAITGSAADGYTITNTHTPATVDIPVTKTWTDNNNEYDTRPEKITVNLLANGNVVRTAEITGPEKEPVWSYTFEGLPEYENGTPISYAVTEDVVEGYTTAIKGTAASGFSIENVLAPGKTSVAVTKTWVDGDDQDGIRPASVAVKLLKNGDLTDTVVELNAANGWTATVSDLPKYDADSKLINYTFEEFKVNGYTTSCNGNMTEGFQIVNTHEPEMIGISGSKTWEDADDQDGVRPGSIIVRLLADGKEVAEAVVTEDSGWTWSFGDMPKYRDHGTEIVYTITEDAVDNYAADIKGDAANGFAVTNTHTPYETSVTVTKAWNDADDQDGLRPDGISVILKADGVMLEDKTVVLGEENNWTYTWTELPVKAAGEDINYEVQEENVPTGYTADITGDAVSGYVITNYHTPDTVTLEGSKTWVDNDNEKGKRPGSITINLLADGEEVAEAAVTEESGWTWSFADMPKFRDHGTEIVYTITEDEVAEYNQSIDGMNVINTLKAPAAWIPMGMKVLEGEKELTAGLFTFNMYDAEGSLIGTAANAADGSITFAEMEFDAAGEYTYIISEAIPEDAEEFEPGKFFKDGIIYDSTAYIYNVTVGLNDDMNYAVTGTELLVQDGENAAPAENGMQFVNVYDSGFGEEEGGDTPGEEPPADNGDGSEDGTAADSGDGEANEESGSDKNRDEGAQTGDDSSLAGFAVIAMFAAAAMILSFRRREE